MKPLLKSLNWILAGLLVWVALFAAFEPVSFLGDSDWPQPFVLAGLALGLVIILNKVRRRLDTWSPQTYQRVVLVMLVLIGLIQLYVALSFMDVGRADGYFVRNQAISLAQGGLKWNHYFMVYPNNVNYTLVEAGLLRWLLPVTKTPWLILNVLRFIWLDTGLVAGLYLLKHWQKWRPGAIWFVFLWLVSVPVYAFGLFDYTDALVFPLVVDSLALITLTRSTRGWRHWLGCLATLLLISLGVALKSNMIVLWLAVGVYILLLGWQHQLTWTQVLGWVVAAFVVLGLVMGGMGVWRQHAGYRAQPDAALPVTSWMAMSLHPGGEGQYQAADFTTVEQEPTAAAKRAKANGLLRQRISKLGVSGVMVHLMKKFRLFWATGDFDSFKLSTQWIRMPSWYRNHQRNIQFWLVMLTQTLYLMVIFESIWALLWSRRHKLEISFLAIMMLGLTAFHVLLWEVEPRYAVPLLPALMVLGTLGWCSVPDWQLTRSRARIGRWFAVFVGAVCALSLGQTSENTVIRQDSVGRQGNGDYFTLPVQRLAPGERMSWSVPTTGPSNGLQLQLQPTNLLALTLAPNVIPKNPVEPVPVVQPSYAKSKLKVELRAQGRLLKTWRTTPTLAAAKPLNYPTTRAKRVQITVINTGRKPVNYSVGRARYNQQTGAVLSQTKVYPQTYLVNTHVPMALTGGLPIVAVIGLLLLAVLWAL